MENDSASKALSTANRSLVILSPLFHFNHCRNYSLGSGEFGEAVMPLSESYVDPFYLDLLVSNTFNLSAFVGEDLYCLANETIFAGWERFARQFGEGREGETREDDKMCGAYSALVRAVSVCAGICVANIGESDNPSTTRRLDQFLKDKERETETWAPVARAMMMQIHHEGILPQRVACALYSDRGYKCIEEITLLPFDEARTYILDTTGIDILG